MNAQEALDALSEAEEHLESAMDALTRAAKHPDLKHVMASYILPHIQSWIDDNRQCGALPDLMERLDKAAEREEEEEL